jgi:hypothetical protein
VIDSFMPTYRVGWWTSDVPDHIDLNLPCIYEWRLGTESLYVGKAARPKRRLREYPNNVRKLIAGEAYRLGKPTSYRAVHHELRSAHDRMLAVIVTVLENCDKAALNERERYWIAKRRAEAETGGPRVLNATT